jgi:signal transduction histidine kinase
VPVALNLALVVLNSALMVCWIALLAYFDWYGTLTLGTLAFALTLLGLLYYLLLTIKASRLNRRQANFVDSVTHELKTPIASLRLYLETLASRPLDDARRREFYQVMEEDLLRLDRLISQLLEVARLDSLATVEHAEEVDLGPLLRECALQAARVHDAPFERTFEFALAPVTIVAPPLVLEMIFRNLLENAVKYGGQPPQVKVEASAAGDKVLVRIADNGEGVPPEERRRIFGLFFRGGDELTRRRPGTGLGLYIVSTLVKKLRGRVRATSRHDEPGSAFEVLLPRQ